MTSIRIMLVGETLKAQAVFAGQETITLVTALADAEFVLQEAEQFRANPQSARDFVQLPVIGSDRPPHDLTRRELEVLRLTAEGHSVRQVAVMLSLSAKTVDAHKVNLMRKLHIHNKAHLVQYAFRHRIITLEQPLERVPGNGFASALLN